MIHVVARKDELLDCETCLLGPDNVTARLAVIVQFQAVNQSIPVKVPIVCAGEEAIPPQVVETVHVQLTRQEILLPRRMTAIPGIDQFGHSVRKRLIASTKGLVQRGIQALDDPDRPILVVGAQARLKEVGERAVPHIMDQGRGKERLSCSPDLGVFVIRLQVLHHLGHEVEDTQGVNQTVVIGTRVSQIANAELVNAPESLDLGAVQNIEQPTVSFPVDADVVVKGITDDLRGHDQPRSRDDLARKSLAFFQEVGVGRQVLEVPCLLHGGCPIVPLLSKENDGRSDLEFLQVGLVKFSGKRFARSHLFGWAGAP